MPSASTPNPLDKHALALGHLCIQWGYLESYVDSFLFSLLLNIKDADVQSALGANMDFRNKLKAIKLLSFKLRRSDDWFEQLSTLINRIDNELAPARNRMIHDEWSIAVTHPPTTESIVRTTVRASLKRPQAFQPQRFSASETVTIKPSDIWKLVENVKIAYGDLVGLLFDHTHRSSRGKPP